MSATDYGTTQRDEETPLISTSQETWHQKFMRVTHQHRFRLIGAWSIIIAVTAVLTISLHYALKDKNPHIPEDDFLESVCTSDRSWFVALMLSIFLGPLGVDRFYLGYIFLGILKLITAGLGGIWWTIDVILLALNILPDHPNGCHLR